MTCEPDPRERARRALERSLRSAAPPPEDAPDPAFFDRLDAALLSLPPLRRDIFLAVRLGGARYAELAGLTGLSARQVEREVANALAQIDRALDDRRRER
jgi:RNA polymerase sigma-70 factor (ECF subfamily)